MTEQPTIDVKRLIQARLISDGLWLQEATSTNTLLRDECPFPTEPGLYLLGTDRQTAGRGRSDKSWSTTGGALTFSLLLKGRVAPPLIALRTGLAVCNAVDEWLSETTKPPATQIKWPNDIILGERKLAGILIEAIPTLGTIIGVGINVNNQAAEADPSIRSTMTSLRDRIGHAVAIADVLESFLKHLHTQLAAASDQIIDDIRNRNWLQGRTVRIIDGPDSAVRAIGQVRDIQQDGALVLETNGSLTIVHSGSVIID